MKHHFWSFMFGLELLLIGVYRFRSDIFPASDEVWTVKRILLLTAGISLLGFIMVIVLPKVINRFTTLEKFEGFSRYLVQASLWCSLSLLAVELLLRGLVYNPPFRMNTTNWIDDLPAVNSTKLWGTEGYGITKFKKWGEIETPYQDNRKDNDVLVFGDSLTEGLQVMDDKKFTSVAETIVRRDGYDADLHNLGHSGAAIADYVSWIPPYRALFKPKVIVLQLNTNDFIESFHLDQYNYFVLREDKTIEFVHTYDLSSGLIQKWRKRLFLIPQIKDLGNQRWSLFMRDAFKNFAAVKADPKTPDPARSAIPETFVPELADQQMQMLLEVSKDIPLIIVLLPSAPSISGDGIQMDDPEHLQVKEFIAHYPGITIVDPLPEFRELVSNGHMPRGFFNSTPGEGHLNNYGNEVVGRVLAQAVEQVLK